MAASEKSPVFGLLGFVTLVYAVAFVGSEGALKALDFWYVTVDRPSWSPPIWLFVPLWTVLYGALAIAGWRVWRLPKRRAGPLLLFAALVLLAALWPWLFFVWHLLLGSVVEVFVAAVVGFLTCVIFARLDRPASLLVAPFLLWLLFATSLNAEIWRMNAPDKHVVGPDVVAKPEIDGAQTGPTRPLP